MAGTGGEKNGWNRPEADETRNSSPQGRSPEPPDQWRPDNRQDYPEPAGEEPNDEDQLPNPAVGYIGRTTIKLEPREVVEFGVARKFIVGSQVVAIVSLFFGGAILSLVAILLAALGYRRLSAIANSHSQPEVRAALKRSGVVAICMGALALVINLVTMAFLYPLVMDAARQGDFMSLFSAPQQPPASGSGAVGVDLFG